MRPAATAAIVGLFLATLAGCEDENPLLSRAEIDRLRAEGEALKKTNLALRNSVRDLEAARSALDEMAHRSRDENEQLKGQLADTRQLLDKQNAQMASLRQQVSDLLARAAPAPPPAAAPIDPSGAAAGVGPAPAPAPPTPRDEFAITEARNAIAELETRIVALQSQINQGRSRVMSLVRATVDVPMVPPAGAYISGGQIYRRQLICGIPTNLRTPSGYTHTHGPQCYADRPIGPAVKTGDFRSQHDKEMAINQVKQELLPLETELKALKDEQDKVKKRLGELLAPIK